MRRRGLSLVCLLFTTWVACGESDDDKPRPTAHSGAPSAGTSSGRGLGAEAGEAGAREGQGGASTMSGGVGGAAGSGTLAGRSGIAGVAGKAGSGGLTGKAGAGGRGVAGQISVAGSGAGASPTPPAGWLCGSFYADDFCDCGCGVVDPDCEDETTESCKRCGGDSCSPFFCPGNIDPGNNALCTAPPPSWTCDERLYRDGARCNCGCGHWDPDCSTLELAACDRCDDEGSCSARECPGTIGTAFNALCEPPEPPEGWTCGYDYGEGSQCNCGCGVPDIDCLTDDPAECDTCYLCDYAACSETLEPGDMATCKQPEGWTCDPFFYADGFPDCDCGCGVPDPDCEEPGRNGCERCPVEGCSAGHCKNIDPTDNSTCATPVPDEWQCDRTHYGDDVCDCGCGALDVDCENATRDECDTCDDGGSCSESVCPGTIDPTNNTTCT